MARYRRKLTEKFTNTLAFTIAIVSGFLTAIVARGDFGTYCKSPPALSCPKTRVMGYTVTASKILHTPTYCTLTTNGGKFSTCTTTWWVVWRCQTSYYCWGKTSTAPGSKPCKSSGYQIAGNNGC